MIGLIAVLVALYCVSPAVNLIIDWCSNIFKYHADYWRFRMWQPSIQFCRAGSGDKQDEENLNNVLNGKYGKGK